MSKVRKYFADKYKMEMQVYDGSVLLFVARLYLVSWPRIAVENFSLVLPDLVYETQRFFNFVNRYRQDPDANLDEMDLLLSRKSFSVLEGF